MNYTAIENLFVDIRDRRIYKGQLSSHGRHILAQKEGALIRAISQYNSENPTRDPITMTYLELTTVYLKHPANNIG